MRITLAAPWTGPDGTNHRAGTTVSVDKRVASQLIYLGRARVADPDPAGKPAATKASAPASGSTPDKGE